MRLRFILLAVLLPLFGICQSVNPAFVVNDKVRSKYIMLANEGMFIFYQSQKYGFMDKNQKILIPAEFEFPDDWRSTPVFSKGKVMVKKDGKWGVIDRTGKKLSPFFDCISMSDYNLQFNVFVLKRDMYGTAKYGVVNADGKELVPFEYAEPISLDSNLIVTKKEHLVIAGVSIYSLRDVTGKVLIPEGTGFDYYDKIIVYKDEKLVMATSGTYNYLLDFNMKELLRLPRSFDPSKSYSKETLELTFGRTLNYFTSNPGTGIREMAFHSVSKDRVFFGNKYQLEGKDVKLGMLDLQGNVIMEPRYHFVFGGFDKYNMCSIGNRVTGLRFWDYGYIDRNGKELYPTSEGTPKFVWDRDAGLAWDPVTKLEGVMNRSGKWVLPPTYTETTEHDRFGGFLGKTKNDNKYHYFDVTGKDYGQFQGTGTYDGYDKEGYACIAVWDSSLRVGFADGSFSEPIPDCKGADAFSEGLAIISTKSTGKLGFIDSSGKVVIPCVYDNVTPFRDGVSRVVNKVDGRLLGGYIDKKGKLIVPVQYDRIGKFQDGYGIIQTDQGFNYVDKTGKLRPSPANAGQIFTEFSSGLAMGISQGANNMRTYTYFDNTFTTKFTLNAYEAIGCQGNIVIASLMPRVYSIFDKKGVKVKDLPSGLQGLDFFGEGMFGVKIMGKWGFMNEKGEMVIQVKYDSVGAFRDGYARVQNAGKWTVINTKDIVQTKENYDYLLLGSDGIYTYFKNYDRKYGVKYAAGGEVFYKFEYANAFIQGKGIVRPAQRYCIVRLPIAK
jgi:hypothetical protein